MAPPPPAAAADPADALLAAAAAAMVMHETDRLHRERDAAGHVIINNYVRLEQIGRGQHGVVCRGLNMNDAYREVALKTIRRHNAREEKIKALRRNKPQALPRDPSHVPVVAVMGTQEHKVMKEIAIMRRCRHAHIVRLIDVINDPAHSKIYMVMEYMGGGEIKWRTSSNDPILTVDQTRRIIRDVILGLEYLHFNGIIHRDIKPANLLWTADRRTVKIADFGVSHFSYAQRLRSQRQSADRRKTFSFGGGSGSGGGRGEGGASSSSSSGVPARPCEADLLDKRDLILLDDGDLNKTAGSPAFLAPEVVADLRGDAISASASATSADASAATAGALRAQVTKAIDVWALGVTLYAFLFGRPPFTVAVSQPHAEWQLYGVICREDWRPADAMGVDRIRTGGRRPETLPLLTRKGKEVRQSEGAVVMQLLDRLLDKDAKKRITLDEVKRYPWFLRDIPNAKEWVTMTTPTKQQRLFVSDQDIPKAMTEYRFGWRQVTRALQRTLRPISSIQQLAHRTKPVTEPVSPTSAEQPRTYHSLGRPKTPSRPALNGRKPTAAGTARRGSSPEPHLRSSADSATHRRAPGSRRGSDALTIPSGASATPGASPAQSVSGDAAAPYGGGAGEKRHMHRLSVLNLLAGWRSPRASTSPPAHTPLASAPPSGTSSAVHSPTTSGAASPLQRAGPSSAAAAMHVPPTARPARAGSASALHARYSEDVYARPGAHGPAHARGASRGAVGRASSYGAAPSVFAPDMRASSWGDAGEYELRSVHSGDAHEHLDDEVMFLGAGGVAHDPVALPTPASLGPVFPAPSGATTPTALAAGPTILHLRHMEADVPPVPSPHAAGHAGRAHTTSPLAGSSSALYADLSYISSDEDDGDAFVSGGDGGGIDDGSDSDSGSFASSASDISIPGQRDVYRELAREQAAARAARLAASTSVYDDSADEDEDGDEDGDGSDSEVEDVIPVEIRRRRPSAAFSASPPPRSRMSSPQPQT